MPLVSLNLLSGDIFLLPRAIVPASYKVLSLPASVVSLIDLSYLFECSMRISSDGALYDYSIFGTKKLIGLSNSFDQVGTFLLKVSASLNIS